jgi:hypothetical protein
MKTKALLVLRVLIFAAACLAGGEAVAAQTKTPLGPNEARVKGHKSALAYAVLLVPAADFPKADLKNELIVPAGPTRLIVSYHAYLSGGAVGGAAEAYNRVELSFEAEAGHEYYAEMWGMTVFNMGFKITDKTTGKIAAQAKVKDQKKAEKEATKPAK